jgi:hypothetical protein
MGQTVMEGIGVVIVARERHGIHANKISFQMVLLQNISAIVPSGNINS